MVSSLPLFDSLQLLSKRFTSSDTNFWNTAISREFSNFFRNVRSPNSIFSVLLVRLPKFSTSFYIQEKLWFYDVLFWCHFSIPGATKMPNEPNHEKRGTFEGKRNIVIQIERKCTKSGENVKQRRKNSRESDRGGGKSVSRRKKDRGRIRD